MQVCKYKPYKKPFKYSTYSTSIFEDITSIAVSYTYTHALSWHIGYHMRLNFRRTKLLRLSRFGYPSANNLICENLGNKVLHNCWKWTSNDECCLSGFLWRVWVQVGPVLCCPYGIGLDWPAWWRPVTASSQVHEQGGILGWILGWNGEKMPDNQRRLQGINGTMNWEGRMMPLLYVL